MSERPFNFSAGPAALPEEVLNQVRDELLDFRGSGMSVMEMSHRSPEFIEVAEAAEADLRTLLGAPDEYRLLFLQGGATTQFAAVPLNLLRGKAGADYIETGSWSAKAIQEARRYCNVNVAATSAAEGFNQIPSFDTWKLNSDAAYVHICGNETIGGVQFHRYPDCAVPLVADLSSELLSRPIDVTQFGLIYAGAQKNIGPAGLTLVIVRQDLLGQAAAHTPAMLDYAVQAKAGSMSNTPPTFAWYVAGLVFKWLLSLGGLEGMAARNAAKAGLLYDALNCSNFYHSPVAGAGSIADERALHPSRPPP